MLEVGVRENVCDELKNWKMDMVEVTETHLCENAMWDNGIYEGFRRE